MIAKLVALVLVSMPTVLYGFTSCFCHKPAFKGSGSMMLRMSSTDKYLNDLRPVTNKSKELINIYDELNLQDAQTYTNKTELHIDSILLNIYKLDSLFFNRNSKNIMFKLRDQMQDVFFCENQTMYRLPNTTRLTSNAFRKFIISEMDTRVDVILYKHDRV